MLITYTAVLPVSGNEPPDALRQALEMLHQADTMAVTPAVSLTVFSTSVPDVIVQIAQAVPVATLGFSVGTGRERLTAGEFLNAIQSLQAADHACHFQGILTDALPFADCLELLQRLYQGPPKTLRQNHYFMLNFGGLHWHGAPSAGGKLTLTDTKALKHKARFQLTAVLECRGSSEKDGHVRDTARTVSQETGIAFDKTKPFAAPDPVAQDAPSPEELWIAEVCFQEAMAGTAAILQERSVSLDGLPGLRPHGGASQAHDQAHDQAVTAGVSERVDLPAVLKSTLKRSMPELTLLSRDAETVLFQQPLAEEVTLLVGFDRHRNSGLGKTFSLLIAVRATAGRFAGRDWSEGLLRLFSLSPPQGPQWTYDTKADLDAALVGVVSLLGQVLPVFGDEVKRWMDPIPSSLPTAIVRRGALTARAGLGEASRLALAWAEDAKLCLVSCSSPVRVAFRLGPCIGLDGGLRPHGVWHYGFHSLARAETMSVDVPSVGPIQALRSPIDRAWFPPLREDWIDSDTACPITAEKAEVSETEFMGAGFAQVFGVLRVERGHGLPFELSWKFTFSGADARGNRRDRTVWLDAVGGREFRRFGR